MIQKTEASFIQSIAQWQTNTNTVNSSRPIMAITDSVRANRSNKARKGLGTQRNTAHRESRRVGHSSPALRAHWHTLHRVDVFILIGSRDCTQRSHRANTCSCYRGLIQCDTQTHQSWWQGKLNEIATAGQGQWKEKGTRASKRRLKKQRGAKMWCKHTVTLSVSIHWQLGLADIED